VVRFPFNRDIVDRIKEKIEPKLRTWNNGGKFWEIDVKGLYLLMKSYKESQTVLFDFGSPEEKQVFIDKITKVFEEEKKKQAKIDQLEKNKKIWLELKKEYEENYKVYSDEVHQNLKEWVELYPHQIVAALFLDKTKNALLSLEMGLGKTVCSIAYCEMNHFDKVCVITPNSLKFNFYNEIEKFTNSKAHIVGWKKNIYSAEESMYIIMNYEIFSRSVHKFDKLNLDKIDCLICDESHRLKNTDTKLFKNFKKIFTDKIFRKTPSKVFLSGTPAPNRAYELYSVLNQISPIEFATKKHFYEFYCGMEYDFYGFGWQTNIGKQKLEELYHKIAPFTYRKRKEEVLDDLPDKIYQKIILELETKEQKLYDETEAGVATSLFGGESENPLTIMLRLRQTTSEFKIDRVKEIIDSLLAEGEKIVIVDVFKSILYKINEMYPLLSAVHTGDQTTEERAEIVKEFQDSESELRIFLGSIQTCNYGLTLTAANKLIILTLPYSVGEYDQVSDRLHRIGQKDTVNIYPVIFKDTIDEYVFETIESKRKEIKKVIDNEDYESNVSESVLNEVLQMLKKKHG
jgi:SNF2 family DNA or RNA helicase